MSARPPAPPRVLVVEDDAFTRTTVCGALRDAGVNVVADTASAAEALDLAERYGPHAAIIDLDLGTGPDGVDVAVALREASPRIGITILTSYGDPRLTGRTVGDLPGGSVYLTKGELRSVDAVAAAIALSIRMASNPRARGIPALPRPRGATAGLTDVQIEVARMVTLGLSNAEIAAQRGVSTSSVERTIMRIAHALGIETTSATNRRVLITRAFLRRTGH